MGWNYPGYLAWWEYSLWYNRRWEPFIKSFYYLDDCLCPWALSIRLVQIVGVRLRVFRGFLGCDLFNEVSLPNTSRWIPLVEENRRTRLNQLLSNLTAASLGALKPSTLCTYNGRSDPDPTTGIYLFYRFPWTKIVRVVSSPQIVHAIVDLQHR
jgi:hypothetical protein